MHDEPTQPVPPLSVPSSDSDHPSSVQVAGLRVPRTFAFVAGGALLLLLCACVGSGVVLGAAGTILYRGLRLPVATSAPTFTIVATETPAATSTSTPSHGTVPTATARAPQGSSSNPWGYNFACCQLIYAPPAGFCSYFACIPNFWNGNGYVVECSDSMFSKSGGLSGVCSYHGGEWRPLYAPSAGGNPTATPSSHPTPTPTPIPPTGIPPTPSAIR